MNMALPGLYSDLYCECFPCHPTYEPILSNAVVMSVFSGELLYYTIAYFVLTLFCSCSRLVLLHCLSCGILDLFVYGRRAQMLPINTPDITAAAAHIIPLLFWRKSFVCCFVFACVLCTIALDN